MQAEKVFSYIIKQKQTQLKQAEKLAAEEAAKKEEEALEMPKFMSKMARRIISFEIDKQKARQDALNAFNETNTPASVAGSSVDIKAKMQ